MSPTWLLFPQLAIEMSVALVREVGLRFAVTAALVVRALEQVMVSSRGAARALALRGPVLGARVAFVLPHPCRGGSAVWEATIALIRVWSESRVQRRRRSSRRTGRPLVDGLVGAIGGAVSGLVARPARRRVRTSRSHVTLLAAAVARKWWFGGSVLVVADNSGS